MALAGVYFLTFAPGITESTYFLRMHAYSHQFFIRLLLKPFLTTTGAGFYIIL